MALDIPLQFHEFKHLNHHERCPKFAEILSKPTSDDIQVSDLDALYTDLESLLGASNIRFRRLENEIKILSEWCDKRDRGCIMDSKDIDFLGMPNITGSERDSMPPAMKPSSLSAANSPSSTSASSSSSSTTSTSTTARVRPSSAVPSDEKPPLKKQKLEEKPPSSSSSTSSTISSSLASSKLKSKGKSIESSTKIDEKLSSSLDGYISRPRQTYDTPSNKFWSYVEPYCADITLDDVKVLEESLNNKADINEYYKIPNLGRHFSIVWAKEDLNEESQEGNKIDKEGKESKKRLSTNLDNLEKKMKGVLHETGTGSINQQQESTSDESCPYGAFTQRLISALVDENIMAPMTESELCQGITLTDEPIAEQRNNLGKRVPLVSNARSLEAAIKEELFSLRLIDTMSDDEAEGDAEDEILAELKRCQAELKSIRTHNKHQVQRLIQRAKREMKKQNLKQRAKVLDAEVMDIFRRFNSSKLRKKGLSRKDRELAWKAIRDRDAIWKMIEQADNSTEKMS